MSVIWDIDTKLGCWIDGSHWSAKDFNIAVVKLTAEHYGYKPVKPHPANDEEWYWESDDALDHLQSLCPHGYWFEIEDNSLYLRSENE
jgi:hypothetical protein